MSEEQMNELTAAFAVLATSDLPGLTVEDIANIKIEVEYGDSLEQIEDPEMREKERKNIFDYLTGAGKAFIELAIQQIIAAWETLKQIAEMLANAISSAILSLAQLPVIVTGSAAGVPNPAWITSEGATKKDQIKSAVQQALQTSAVLIAVAASISYPVPEVVLAVIGVLGTLMSLADTIPS